jgi:hypothetical protein
MTTNGLKINPESQEFKRRLLHLSTYLATLIRETLEVAAAVMIETCLETRHASSMRWSSYNMLLTW